VNTNFICTFLDFKEAFDRVKVEFATRYIDLRRLRLGFLE
jgi:hypothetical protein